jgi:hypothetical protein
MILGSDLQHFERMLTDLDILGENHQRQPPAIVQRLAESRGAPRHHPYLTNDAPRSRPNGMGELGPSRHTPQAPHRSIQPTVNE